MQLGSRDCNSQCYCVITNGCDGSDCYGSVAGSFSAIIAFSALTLLVGVRKSIWPAKIRVMGCWFSNLSGARCRLFAHGPADATAIRLLPHLNPDWFYFSGTGLARLSWKRGGR